MTQHRRLGGAVAGGRGTGGRGTGVRGTRLRVSDGQGGAVRACTVPTHRAEWYAAGRFCRSFGFAWSESPSR